MLDLNQRPNFNTPRVSRAPEKKQPRRLLLALALLLVALVAVILRDSQFWFGSDDSTIADSDSSASEVAKAAAKSAPAQDSKSIPVPASKKSPVAKRKAENTTAAPATESASAPAGSGSTAITRTMLPPMDVEVVAGDNHRVIRPGSGNSTKVEIPKTASALRQATTSSTVTDAADREPVALATSLPAHGSYEATYPLLAQHMNIQGSVVLQALIGADGIIENLRVLSGPAILASAAQQAVREWRFKPIVQNGQAVESKARITVNFIIKVSDNSPKTAIAENESEQIPVLSR